VAAHLLAQGLIAECVEELEVVLRTEGLPDSIYAAAELQIQLSLLAKESFAEARGRALAVLAGSSRSSANVAMTGALITLAVLDWDEGRPTDAIGLATAAAERAERDPEISCTGVPKFLLGWMLTDIGKLDEARELIRASGELRRGLWPALLPVLNSHLLLASGQLEGAAADAAKGLALVQGSHLGLFEPAARSVLAAVAFFQGNQRGAADLMDGVRSGVPRHSLFGLRLNAFPDLQLREASDGFPAAVDGLQEALGERHGDVAVSQGLQLEDPTAAAWLVRGALATGNRAMAERAVRCAIELASDNAGIPSIAAAANHARGVLEADVDLLLDAATNHSRPWARARALEDAGVTVSATGDTAGARPHLEGALARYQELGAEHDVARVRSLLRTMGVRQCHWRRRERPVSGWESLTETERSVSDLVAQGLTNRQAAQQMFLSPHTIDFHLRQIFRKLQIDSRVDLTRMTIERDAGAGAEAQLHSSSDRIRSASA
jgi:DNA-binding CsgD family transcriptional regulator